MVLVLAPDFNKVISDYLRSVDDIAAMIGRRVVTKPPDQTDQPWVEVGRIGASGRWPDHLVECLFQLDCYAGLVGGVPEAETLAANVRAAFGTIQYASHDGAVVTGAVIVNDFNDTDPDLMDHVGKRRELVRLSVVVWMHG